MTGLLAFQDRYANDQACIAALAAMRWPGGFVCAGCAGRRGYQLRARPRVWQCAGCGRQRSVTAGTIFHRTRTPLRKWFLAAHWLARDKRGVSATVLARELGLRYGTAWLIAHKLRHALGEASRSTLTGLVEFGQRSYGGGTAGRDGASTRPKPSILAVAVEKLPATKRRRGGIAQSGCIAGRARLAVLSAATAAHMDAFVAAAAAPGARLDGPGLDGAAGSGNDGRRDAAVQGGDSETMAPISPVLFTNVKAWLNGTFHGIGAKHLPRYAREWTYRFNRRHRIAELAELVLRRAVWCRTITYRDLVAGLQPQGAVAVLSG